LIRTVRFGDLALVNARVYTLDEESPWAEAVVVRDDATALSLETWGTVDNWVQAIADYAEANSEAPILFGYGFLATTFGLSVRHVS